ncbi:MAG TPA: hypothetical protein VMP67_05490 [Candidatus Limnocylindria bacterium]|nr:hypothetical protein [Candidatus Limnocylindria bacterium]
MSRVYPLESLYRKVFLAVGGVLAAFGLVWPLICLAVLGGFSFDVIELAIVGLPTAGFLLVGLLVASTGRMTRLELRAEGLVLHLPGGRLEAGWEDVGSIAPAPWGPFSGQALVLTRPARGRRPWWFRFVGSELMDQTIPLSPFALPLRGSRLEGDLRGRLPHLFD